MPPTSPTRLEIIHRAVRGECPRCRHRGLFVSRYRLAESCPQCGLPLDREDGFSYGAVPLNYSLTCMLWVLPVAVLALCGVLGLNTALILGGAGVATIPWLTYRHSKRLWVGIYYAVLPHELAPPERTK